MNTRDICDVCGGHGNACVCLCKPLVSLRWKYSRNQLRHAVEDGDKYGTGCHDLFEIRDNRPYGARHLPQDGYRLLHKGKLVDSHRTVKVLKETAARISAKQP